MATMQRWVTPDVRAPVLPVAVTPLQRSLSEGALFFSGQRPYARADVLIQDQQQRPTRLDWIPRGSSPGELVRILDVPGKQTYCLAGSGRQHSPAALLQPVRGRTGMPDPIPNGPLGVSRLSPAAARAVELIRIS